LYAFDVRCSADLTSFTLCQPLIGYVIRR